MSFELGGSRLAHEAAHKRENGWTCSVCGCSYTSRRDRKRHESLHGFFRFDEDEELTTAVKIQKSQLSTLKNVGVLLAEMQRSALPSIAQKNDEDASVEELQQVERLQAPSNRPESLAPKSCPICGKGGYQRPNHLKEHVQKHSLQCGFSCSLCGVRLTNAAGRKSHEKVVHRFERSAYCNRKEAVKIPKEALRKYTNVGKNFAEVQRHALAIPSRANNHRQTTTTTAQPMPQSPANDSISKEPVVQPTTPTVQSPSKANQLMVELMKKPKFMFYDYKAIGSEFSILPISAWKNFAACEVLILRLDTKDWTHSLELDSKICSFMLSDQFGYFVAFEKPYSRLLSKHLASTFSTFTQLMQLVNDQNLTPALIIADEDNRNLIQHLVSPNFVVM
ncbi:hypothetical protein M3Y94_00646000 [Aphelenchoides besseyi]|nr:hypothetical protein M3Y94_00646000 [Aphelenchoides besseyi]